MPMSNPTSKAECTPEDAYRWTNGRAVVATGSPFLPVTLPNGTKVIPSQCNNMYVFPGVGLAASVAGVTTITDKMLYLSSVAVTDTMNAEEIAEGRTFPSLKRIRAVSANVATAVIEEALRQGLATKMRGPMTWDQIHQYVVDRMYYPYYTPFV